MEAVMARTSGKSSGSASAARAPFLAGAGKALLQRKCACGESAGAGNKCEECKKKDGLLHRRGFGGVNPPSVPPIVHEVLRSPGQPLGSATRTFMEARLGHDFSRIPIHAQPAQQACLNCSSHDDPFEQEAEHMATSIHSAASPAQRTGSLHDFSRVRIHADERAAVSARAVNALAYTLGQDVVFGTGRYAPHTTEGRGLLAHELTHVLQQEGAARVVQRQEADKKPKPAPPAKPPKPAAGAPKMPVVLHYVSKTSPLVLISGKDEYNRCGRDLWTASEASNVFSAASKIMKDGFGIELTGQYDDLECIEDATVVKELNPLQDWIAKEIVKKKKRKLDAKNVHMFLIDAFYAKGVRDNTVGEVVEIGGNLGAIIDSGDAKAKGRTLAHELGHTLDLYHPKDYGMAAQMEDDFATCAEGSELMAWGDGTCVSPWMRKEALKNGKEDGRLH